MKFKTIINKKPIPKVGVAIQIKPNDLEKYFAKYLSGKYGKNKEEQALCIFEEFMIYNKWVSPIYNIDKDLIEVRYVPDWDEDKIFMFNEKHRNTIKKHF